MSDEAGQTDRGREGDPSGRPLWFIACGVVAVGLWAQWLGPGLVTELQSADGSELVAIVYLLPLVTAVVAVVWRHPAGRIALFPISFLPGLALLPPLERQALTSPTTLLLALATFAVYLGVAAARPGEIPHRSETGFRPATTGSSDAKADSYRLFLFVRFGLMAVLFAVITHALFFDASIQRELAGVGGDDAADMQHLFMAVTVYLGWSVAVYMGAILPALNWEYHRRRSPVPESQRRLLARPRRLGRRIWLWLVFLLVITSLSLWWLI